jgi:proline iminopeptidase
VSVSGLRRVGRPARTATGTFPKAYPHPYTVERSSYEAWFAAAVWLALMASVAVAGQTRSAAGQRESVLDRKVHLEKELVTDIPTVPRLCDTMASKKTRIQVGDAALFVEQESRGTPLVLVNGGPGGTHHEFHPWFSRLKGVARVIYDDQRGCGQSDYHPGADGYSLRQGVSDLEAVRKALRIERWVVLGYSYGGLLAQSYALRYPEHLAGLVLLGAEPGVWAEMKPTRQYDFLSAEERTRMREISAQVSKLATERHWTDEEKLMILVYNNHLNGDWKRQHSYTDRRATISPGWPDMSGFTT